MQRIINGMSRIVYGKEKKEWQDIQAKFQGIGMEFKEKIDGVPRKLYGVQRNIQNAKEIV